MNILSSPQIQAADLLRQGVILTFSDGVIVLLPTTLLLEVREHPEAMQVPPVDDDY